MSDKLSKEPIESTEERRRLDAGSAVLYEGVAEAYEPEWRNILTRVFHAMQVVDVTIDQPKPWKERG